MKRHVGSQKEFSKFLRDVIEQLSIRFSQATTLRELTKLKDIVRQDNFIKDINKKIDRMVTIQFNQSRQKMKGNAKIDLDKIKKDTLDNILKYLDSFVEKIENKQKELKDKSNRNKIIALLLLLGINKDYQDRKYNKILEKHKTELNVLKELQRVYYTESNKKTATNVGNTQTGNVFSNINRSRAKQINTGAYIWRNKKYPRVRDSHKVMNGVLVFWGETPVPGEWEKYRNEREVHPGEDYNCQCTAEFVDRIEQIEGLAKGSKIRVWYNGNLTTMSFKEVYKKLFITNPLIER
jgi:SPP1 gp7 family putative phage head morphogenesis protein